MLETVQGIVVYEILQRGLPRQDMTQVFQQVLESPFTHGIIPPGKAAFTAGTNCITSCCTVASTRVSKGSG